MKTDLKSKMYILILEDINSEIAITAAAHGSIICYLQYMHNFQMKNWLSSSFEKVICKVSEKELKDSCLAIKEYTYITESKLKGKIVGVAFLPREEWPMQFKYFKLWGI